MIWRIEEDRWLTESEYNNYSTDGKHKVTVVSSDEQMGTIYYYVHMISYQEHTYEQLTTCLIRERYDLNSEFALLRQRDTKPEEFKAYNDFAEECKVSAQAMIKEREDFYASLVEPEVEPVPEHMPTDPVL